MFIRRAQTRSLASGQIYATFRLVQTVRTGSAVRQSTLLNLGSHFDLPQPQWPALVKRIEDLLHGQAAVADPMLSDEGQVLAQRYAAQLLALRASAGDGARTPALSPGGGDVERFQDVDLDSLELVRPRSVGVEHAGLSAMRQCGFEAKLAELGLNPAQIAAAVGNIVARMACPGSELASHGWLQQHSGLGELLGFDFEAMDLSRLYRASDTLYRHRVALQEHLFAQAQTLFSLGQTITLYDLTNTYFEGAAAGVRKAKRGHSKECRSDCPLVTLALVLDGSGFVRRSQVFAGNTSEPATLADMLSGLQAQPGATVVMDAGIATEANLAWLRQQGYHYVVVSRLRQRQFDPTQASEVQTAGDVTVKLYRVMDPHGNLLLYCHSPAREQKDRAIDTAKASGFEAALGKLQAGLSKPRGSHDLATIMQRLGRAKQRYARAAQHLRRAGPAGRQRHASGQHHLDQDDHAGLCGHAPGRVLPAQHLGEPGRRHALAHLHHADQFGVGVSLAQDRPGPAPGVSPDRPPRRGPPVHQRAGLPLRAHAAHPAQGPRHPRRLAHAAPNLVQPAQHHRHACTSRWPHGACAQSLPA